MSGTASQFVGDIPALYDNNLGPNIFEGFARDIASRAAALMPGNVLELAAGTGIVTRMLRDALPEGVRLTVTDLNDPMLDVARRKFDAAENVVFQAADAMALPFADGEFDLIVCQFGVMFFPDKAASFGEALRVLRPGGTYLFNTWGTWAENPFAALTHRLVEETFPDNTPGFYRVPFSYADGATGLTDLQAAGFSTASHETVSLTRDVPDLNAFARGLICGNPLMGEIGKRPDADPDKLVATLAGRLRAAWGPEPAAMPLKANLFHARK